MQDPGFQDRGQSPAPPINRADGIRLRGQALGPRALALKLFEGSAHASPMAFLVAGTLQVASQVADARESLGRKVGAVWPSPLLAPS